MGEEKKAAWPERSEGLVRPVLCVCHTCSREKQVLFLVHILSVLGPLTS